MGKLPTVEELLHLVNAKLITQDEAKEILFKSETEEDRDKEGLEAEIKFLRDLSRMMCGVTLITSQQYTGHLAHKSKLEVQQWQCCHLVQIPLTIKFKRVSQVSKHFN